MKNEEKRSMTKESADNPFESAWIASGKSKKVKIEVEENRDTR